MMFENYFLVLNFHYIPVFANKKKLSEGDKTKDSFKITPNNKSAVLIL